MNPTIPIFKELNNIIDYQLYNVQSKNIITLEQFTNMSYYTSYNIFVKVYRDMYNYDIYSLKNVIGGHNLANILYIIRQYTNKITRKLINECINLMNNQEFRDYWQYLSVGMNIDRFLLNIETSELTIIEDEYIMSN